MPSSLPISVALQRAVAIEAVKDMLTQCLSALDTLGCDRAAIRVDEAIWLLTSSHEQSAMTAKAEAELAECFGG